MPRAGGPRAPRHATEGPPSERARASLSEGLRREVADARVRFEEAGLRAETHRLLGDDRAAAAVVREQGEILADVEDRLGRAVSAAVVERDAEQVLADVTAGGPVADVVVPGAEAPQPSESARRPALAGVASMVAILGVATAAVLGLARGLGPIDVAEVSVGASPEATDARASATSATPPRPVAPLPGGAVEGPDRDGVVTPDGIDGSADTDGAAAGEDDGDDPAPDAPPAPLGTVVQDLIDAVADLERPGAGPAGPTPAPEPGLPTEDTEASVPGVDDVDGPSGAPVEEPTTDSPAPEAPEQGAAGSPEQGAGGSPEQGAAGPDGEVADGFVPAPSAQ